MIQQVRMRPPQRAHRASILEPQPDDQVRCLACLDVIALNMEAPEPAREQAHQVLIDRQLIVWRHKPWVLLTIHNPREYIYAQQLADKIRRLCLAVITVKEQYPNETAAAALALHRLHFPQIPEQERKSHILLLGCCSDGHQPMYWASKHIRMYLQTLLLTEGFSPP